MSSYVYAGDLHECCLYNKLNFAILYQQAKKCTVVTFHQPLWWKAVSIMQAESSESDPIVVIVCLDELHLQISFADAFVT